MINLFLSMTKSMSYSFIWMLFVIPSCGFSVEKHHNLCSAQFSCANRSDLLYPLWIPGVEEELNLNCSIGLAELNVDSVKFRIQEDFPITKLAGTDYIGDLFSQDSVFTINIFPFVPRTEKLPSYVWKQLSRMDKGTQDNQNKALEEYFEHGDNRKCLMCMESGGACGYDQSSGGFVCYCVDVPHNHTCGSRYKGSSLSTEAKAGIGAASLAIMGIVLAVVCLLCVFSQRRKTSDYLIKQNLEVLIPLKHYSYVQVKRITNSFAEVVGKGGFGTVFRGTLDDGRSVAVKILKDSKGDGEDFINEVVSISKTSHVNIVSMLGFCSEGSKRAIIYEYLENGSLDQFISIKTSTNMDWMALYNIALGVAHGLEYLHHGCKTKIVHFDIKPQNVLLDDSLCPKVSDFGLAKICGKKGSILSLMGTRGTIGYIAPEVFSRMYGRVSHKSDVYSYGMLVLEMIGARNKERADQNSASNTSSMYFPEWIYKDLEKGNNGRLTENEISSEEEDIVRKMTLVGLWCIQSSPSDRPAMNRVIEMMEGSVDALEIPPRPSFQTPALPLQESSTLSEDISVYTDV